MKHVRPLRISECNSADSPCEQLFARGTQTLSDTDLLAVFLGNNRDKARATLSAFGPLTTLLRMQPQELARLPGIGPSTAARLLASLEIGARDTVARLERGETLTDPGAAGRYFAQRLRGHPNEVFAVLFLDTRHRALAFEELFRGTVDGAEVHPREVVRRALVHNAAAVIVGHNHPSGSAEPSAADRAVTARLKQALALVDIRLLDHFVVGDGVPVSLAARGWV